jgi:AraC-like DNA-binding protein
MYVPGGMAARPPLFAMWGPGRASRAHAHHSLHVMLAREGRLRFRGEHAKRDTLAAGVATPPDVPHAIDASGTEVVLVFVEAESEDGARLGAKLGGAILAIDDRERDVLIGLVKRAEPDILAGAAAMIARLHGGAIAPRTMHPRVKRVLKHLEQASPDADTSLDALAKVADLSTSRLVHAFTESTGISLRAFLLWRKVQRAGAQLPGPAPLAAVAQSAGFSDAAHLTRTFRRTFGVTPSELRTAMKGAGIS